MKKILLLVSVIGICVACAPDEGKGGLASIEGVVMTQNINSLQEKSGDLYPATDADVYISYGESGLADDKGRTGYNGKYKFSNLTKGDYTIFVYSDDTLSNTKYPKLTFSQKVSLDKKKSEAVADTMIVYKHVDYDDGGGIVMGKAYQVLCKTSGVIVDTIFAQDEDVFIRYKNSNTVLKKIQVDYKGDFRLDNLIPGQYTLYMFSQVFNYNATNNEFVTRDFEITTDKSVCIVEPIYTKNYKKIN